MKIIKLIKDFFNNRRSMKIIVEFFFFFLAAFLGGTLSLIIFKMNLDFRELFLLAMLCFLMVVCLIIFWDWYEGPSRINSFFLIRNIHSNIKLILEEIKGVKDRIKRR